MVPIIVPTFIPILPFPSIKNDKLEWIDGYAVCGYGSVILKQTFVRLSLRTFASADGLAMTLLLFPAAFGVVREAHQFKGVLAAEF